PHGHGATQPSGPQFATTNRFGVVAAFPRARPRRHTVEASEHARVPPGIEVIADEGGRWEVWAEGWATVSPGGVIWRFQPERRQFSGPTDNRPGMAQAGAHLDE